jgi:cytochrome c oxidase assembly protein subunit 15
MDNASVANTSATPYNAKHHTFAVIVACCTFLLILAGALVTSNDAGLSVPDWPTSFGSMYRIPPMTGGVQFEHGHRMVAQFIGLLTIILAVWTQRVDRRPWMRTLGWAALGTVIAQGMLGGLTVLLQLPPAVSTAHATLGQTFFCIVVSIALFTGRTWVESLPRPISDPANPRLIVATTVTVVCVWLQLILGAAFRHSGMRIIPHLIGAVVVTGVIHWASLGTIKRYRHIPQLRKPALALLMLLGLQLVLGIFAYITRILMGKDPSGPLLTTVVSTVAHVANGALVLATAVVLAIQVRRYLAAPEAVQIKANSQRPATA